MGGLFIMFIVVVILDCIGVGVFFYGGCFVVDGFDSLYLLIL